MAEFELRWVIRYEEDSTATERVLQIRHREGPRGEDWWGEWEDVPVEDWTK